MPRHHRRSPIVQMLLLALAAFLATTAGAEQRVYKIGLTFPFPPWGIGPLEGIDHDLLEAVCAANAPMRCMLEALPSEGCVDTDNEGNMIIGEELVSGAIDGCVAWFDTAERRRLGAEFSQGYSRGPLSQLIAAEGDTTYGALGDSGSLDGATVGFFAGFFTDTECLGIHYSDFSASFYSSQPSGRDQLLTDLLSGAIDLAFWDNVETVPEGAHVVGATIDDCGPQLSLMTYPPSRSRPHHSDALRRDFNCGLALIQESGEMESICDSSPYPGGDPTCVLDGPPPTVQCREDNPPDDAGPPGLSRR